MQLLIAWSLALVMLPAFSSPVLGADDYVIGPDSTTQPSVPRGEILKFQFDKSKIFPGTVRDVWVYVPQQYTPDKPACVFVCQDGLKFNAPTVFDNLINKKEMPVTIGVFVMHGKVRPEDAKVALDRFNRSYEYDGLGDNYARFLLNELLPEVETMKAKDGRAIELSHDGNDRCIGGSSSGAIAAFTAAWERPDAFSRVFSSIGTYVDLRGGARYPSLIRKYESKPIRVFLQDGSADNNKYGGDWWMANQMMERALTFAGYEVQHVWGDGGHTGKQANAIFPDAMRYLWKDWPAPVKKGRNQNEMMMQILVEGEDWQQVGGSEYGRVDAPAVNPNGEVLFRAMGKTYMIGIDGAVVPSLTPVQAFDAEGKPHALPEASDPFSKPNDLVIAHNGNAYLTDDPKTGSDASSKVWLIRPDSKQEVVDTGLKFANGVTLSPDQSLLYVSDYRSHWVYSYHINADGTLADKQQYYWLHAPDTADDAGGDGMCVDVDGRLYVSTRLGVQVCDQAGRVNCILPTPNGKISALTFGGQNFDTLFATSGDKIFKRKMNVKGNPAWSAPQKPAPPRL
jgi:sugar lactone lactonase YvrE/enterochelin esterase-like enzyme